MIGPRNRLAWRCLMLVLFAAAALAGLADDADENLARAEAALEAAEAALAQAAAAYDAARAEAAAMLPVLEGLDAEKLHY